MSLIINIEVKWFDTENCLPDAIEYLEEVGIERAYEMIKEGYGSGGRGHRGH